MRGNREQGCALDVIVHQPGICYLQSNYANKDAVQRTCMVNASRNSKSRCNIQFGLQASQAQFSSTDIRVLYSRACVPF